MHDARPGEGRLNIIGKPMITELQIQIRTSEVAAAISEEFKGERLLIIAVLKGAFMFAADLMRRLHEIGLKPDIDFIRASSYADSDESSGKVYITFDESVDLKDRRILLVDDIVDSGLTLATVSRHLRERGCGELKICVLLDKPARRVADLAPDYVGFLIPDRFVVGYGLDYAEKFRYLPYVTALDAAEQGK